MRQIAYDALVISLLVGCSGVQTAPAVTREPINTPVLPQEFTIISAYEGMAAYVEAAGAASTPDLPALFRQYVVEPYWEDCAAGGEFVKLAENALATPIMDMSYLSGAVSVLRASNIEQIVEEALQESATVLPGPHTTVCIFVSEPRSTYVRDDMNGVTGLTAGSGKIWLQIYPNDTWRDWIPYAVAHEYHHSVWTDRHFHQIKSSDLVDYLVFEGRADSFARLLSQGLVAPWTEALTTEQERREWRLMQNYLDTPDFAIQRLFMSGGDSTPRWTGYTIGFHIVQSYLRKHPDMSVEEWTAMDAHRLLEESGYNAGQQ